MAGNKVIPLNKIKNKNNNKKELDYSKIEEEVSQIKEGSTRERLEYLRESLLELIPIAKETYKLRPGQGNAYALSNLVNQLQSIEEQLQDLIDPEQIAHVIFERIVRPRIEFLILELGKKIKRLQITCPKRVKKQQVKKQLDSLFSSFGKLTEETLEQAKEEFEKRLLEFFSNS